MKRALYRLSSWLALASAFLQLAFLAWAYGSVLLGATLPLPNLGRGVLSFYVVGVLSLVEGLHVPLYPVVGRNVLGSLGGATVAILALRRILIWRRLGAAPPVACGGGAAVVLGICMASLLVAACALLAAPLLAANPQIAYVFRLFGALLVPAFLSLPAKYLLGVTLLVIELASLQREGWAFFPRPSAPAGDSAAVAAPSRDSRAARVQNLFAGPGMRRAALAGVVVIVVMTPVWAVFPTGLIHERLCRTRAGEHVYEKVRAKSYLFVGEGASDDGLHLNQALDDLAERRVDFIEVLKVSGNMQQRNVFGSMFGSFDPAGRIFRITVGPAGTAHCLKRPVYYGVREKLPPEECLQYVAVEKAASRYRVEAVYNEPATWLTPALRTDGARIIDTSREITLGEDLIFANTSLLAFFVLGEQRMECPPRHGRRPARLIRKVLLGEE